MQYKSANTRLEERSWGQRITEAPFEGGQVVGGAAAPRHMWMIGLSIGFMLLETFPFLAKVLNN
jgi:hypothetical protein